MRDRRGATLAIALASLVAGVLVAVPAVWMLKPAATAPLARLSVPLPSGERLPFTQQPLVAISADGSRLAFVAASNGVRRLYLRQLESGEASVVEGSEGAENPIFSPDGRWLGFTAAGNLLKVSVAGGVPLSISRAPNLRGLAWGDDGTIVFAPTYGINGIVRVAAAGGQPQEVVRRQDNDPSEAFRWPQLLSDHNIVLFTAWRRNIDEAEIVAQRLDSGERKVVVRGGTHPRYVPSGQLLYLNAGTLMAVRFDLDRMETVGSPVPVMQRVAMTSEGAGQYDVSRAGALIFVPGDVQGNGRTLQWVDRAGREQPLDTPPRYYSTPRISPDGQRIAVTISEAIDEVWVFDIGRRIFSRLTSQFRSINPVWTPDSKRIVYRSVRDGRINLFARNADGTGQEDRLTVSPVNQTPLAMSPDGQTLVFGVQTLDLWTLPLAGDRTPRPLVETPFRESGAVVSPDGAWLAYSSDESGRAEVYAQPFPNGGSKIQVSTDGGQWPRWSASGEIFYLSAKGIMVVRATTRPALAVTPPQFLFAAGQYVANNYSFDVTPDGQRILILKEDDRAASTSRIDLVLNWSQEVTRLVGSQ